MTYFRFWTEAFILYSTPGGSRTHKNWFLRPAPMPIRVRPQNTRHKNLCYINLKYKKIKDCCMCLNLYIEFFISSLQWEDF